MSHTQLDCTIYRCSRKDEMYLYVKSEQVLDELPDTLHKAVGELEQVMQLQLHAERKLARADATEVMTKIVDEGYYLQMPPTQAELVEAVLDRTNSTLNGR